MVCFDKNFDNNQISYDLEKYNLPGWALDKVQEIFPFLPDLETMHLYLSPPQVVEASAYVQKACKSKEFTDILDSIIEENILPLVDNEIMIQRFGTMRCVVPNQESKGRLLGFHTGIFNGNGWGLRTLWFPFTETRDTNTMQILPYETSQEISKRVIDEQWSFDKIQEECLKYSFPVELNPGQIHLFTQGHWHGNVNNETNKTRVSMDLRILVKDEQYHRKLPGGYFRFLRQTPEENDDAKYTGKTFVTYAGWNSEYTSPIPLPLQRMLIDSYCKDKGIKYNDYQYELEFMDWLPNLRKFIAEDKPDGIVLLSIWGLPDQTKWRNEILNLALSSGVELHFANENIILRTEDDLNHIEKVRNFSTDTSSPEW